MDYTSGRYNVTIPTGETTAAFNVPIKDDDILEGDETFMLTIDPSLPTGVKLGTPSEATVTIMNDDRELIQIYMILVFKTKILNLKRSRD